MIELQVIAKDALEHYEFNRFRNLAGRLLQDRKDSCDVPRNLIGKGDCLEQALGSSSVMKEFYFMEEQYRLFLEWMLKEREEAYAPSIYKYHPNCFSRLASARFLLGVEEEIAKLLRPDTRTRWNDYIVTTRTPEIEILAPIYLMDMMHLPEDFSDDEVWQQLYNLRDQHGKALDDIMLRKIPHFPPEVDERRKKIIISSREIFDEMYIVLVKHCCEKGLLSRND